MKRAAAFLHGVYRRRDIPYYLTLTKGRTTLAVDGGYRFFRLAGVAPNVLIGDFDSIRKIPRDLPRTTKVVQFPREKDKTDAHLAIEYCLEHGAKEINVIMPGWGEVDHALGSILLLGLEDFSKRGLSGGKIRIVNRKYEVRLLADSEAVFTGNSGEIVSVLPLSKKIELTCRGMEYDCERTVLRFGESRGQRNRIVKGKASVRVEGKALVVRRYGGQ